MFLTEETPLLVAKNSNNMLTRNISQKEKKKLTLPVILTHQTQVQNLKYKDEPPLFKNQSGKLNSFHCSINLDSLIDGNA